MQNETVYQGQMYEMERWCMADVESPKICLEGQLPECRGIKGEYCQHGREQKKYLGRPAFMEIIIRNPPKEAGPMIHHPKYPPPAEDLRMEQMENLFICSRCYELFTLRSLVHASATPRFCPFCGQEV